MSRNIWLFGDSFAGDDHHQDSCERNYYNLLKSRLQANLFNYGLGRTSLPYMYEKFNEIRHLIKENDVLIFCLTESWRQYFFHDRPQAGSFHMPISHELCSNIELDAMEKYAAYLHRPENDKTNLVNFLYNIQYLTDQLSLKTFCFSRPDLNQYPISIEDFPLINFGNACLAWISTKESYDETVVDFVFSKIPGYNDPRINHLCMSNHKVLADKIFDVVMTGEKLDLMHGFHENLITVDSLNSMEFIQKEFRPNTPYDHIPPIFRRQ